MPVNVKKRGGKFRVVEKNTEKIVKNANGRPVDGGGHSSRIKAEKQAAAININKSRKK